MYLGWFRYEFSQVTKYLRNPLSTHEDVDGEKRCQRRSRDPRGNNHGGNFTSSKNIREIQIMALKTKQMDITLKDDEWSKLHTKCTKSSCAKFKKDPSEIFRLGVQQILKNY